MKSGIGIEMGGLQWRFWCLSCIEGEGGLCGFWRGWPPHQSLVVGLLNSHLRGSLMLLSSFCYISRIVTIVLEWGLFDNCQIVAKPVHNTDGQGVGFLRHVDIEDPSFSVNSIGGKWLNFTWIFENFLFFFSHCMPCSFIPLGVDLWLRTAMVRD